jgi:hypothetical protein
LLARDHNKIKNKEYEKTAQKHNGRCARLLARDHKKRKLTAKEQQKLNVKKRYRFKKATLYEREVIKKQKFFIRRQKLPYSYNMWLGNRSLNFLINLMLWCMRVFYATSVTEIILHV